MMFISLNLNLYNSTHEFKQDSLQTPRMQWSLFKATEVSIHPLLVLCCHTSNHNFDNYINSQSQVLKLCFKPTEVTS